MSGGVREPQSHWNVLESAYLMGMADVSEEEGNVSDGGGWQV